MKQCCMLIAGCLFFTGCIFKSVDENSLAGTWRLFDVTTADQAGTDFSKTAELKKIVKEGALLCLFNDAVYTSIDNSGKFVSGTWQFNKQKKMVNFSAGGAATHSNTATVEYTNAPVLVIANGDLLFKYIKESKPLAKAADDPFYPLSNKWRQQPSQREDTAALKARLANYFQHLALLLSAVKERKQEVVSFSFSQGPVKIYNGGIGIHPYDITPASWKQSFYNDSDAITAYNIYQQYLQHSHYRGAGTGEWIVDDYNILLSIYGDFEGR